MASEIDPNIADKEECVGSNSAALRKPDDSWFAFPFLYLVDEYVRQALLELEKAR